MEYNQDYIDLRYRMISSLLIDLPAAVLDISYRIFENQLFIQIVSLEGFAITENMVKNIKESLCEYEIVIYELHVTKEQYNESEGEWEPRYYEWLDYPLFSKSEAQ